MCEESNILISFENITGGRAVVQRLGKASHVIGSDLCKLARCCDPEKESCQKTLKKSISSACETNKKTQI